MNETEIIYIEVPDVLHPDRDIVETIGRFINRGFEVRLIATGDPPPTVGSKDIILRTGRK